MRMLRARYVIRLSFLGDRCRLYRQPLRRPLRPIVGRVERGFAHSNVPPARSRRHEDSSCRKERLADELDDGGAEEVLARLAGETLPRDAREPALGLATIAAGDEVLHVEPDPADDAVLVAGALLAHGVVDGEEQLRAAPGEHRVLEVLWVVLRARVRVVPAERHVSVVAVRQPVDER